MHSTDAKPGQSRRSIPVTYIPSTGGHANIGAGLRVKGRAAAVAVAVCWPLAAGAVCWPLAARCPTNKRLKLEPRAPPSILSALRRCPNRLRHRRVRVLRPILLRRLSGGVSAGGHPRAMQQVLRLRVACLACLGRPRSFLQAFRLRSPRPYYSSARRRRSRRLRCPRPYSSAHRRVRCPKPYSSARRHTARHTMPRKRDPAHPQPQMAVQEQSCAADRSWTTRWSWQLACASYWRVTQQSHHQLEPEVAPKGPAACWPLAAE